MSIIQHKTNDPNLKYLVLDLNGTLAQDGKIISGVSERLSKLKEHYHIYILTADMHGTGKAISEEIGIDLVTIGNGNDSNNKGAFIANLGPNEVVSIGAGANDANMLKMSALGIAVLGPEGLASTALLVSDIVAPSITVALDLLLKPERIKATLRT